MIKKRPKTGKVLFQPLIGLKVNLYSCVAMNYFGEIKIVKRADDNDREQRNRPKENRKDDPIIISSRTFYKMK